MSENLSFFMPMKNPPTITHQQKQVTVRRGKPVFYEPDELKRARSLLQGHLAGYVPKQPYDKAVQCVVKWFFPTHDANKMDGDWRTSRPDTHNLNKLLFDVMEDLGFWVDDSLVVSETIQKFWVKESPSGIYIQIRELE